MNNRRGLKILHIAKFYPPEPGGIENFIRDLAEAQAGQGHSVCVLAHQADVRRKTAWEKINGVHVCRVASLGQVAYAPVSPGFPAAVNKVSSFFRPDLIHVQLPNTSAFWLLLAGKRCPLVLQWQSDIVPSTIDRKMKYLYKLYKPWERRLLKRADRIICSSPAYLESSPALSPFQGKSVAIGLGINEHRIAGPGRDERGVDPERPFTVLSVGRFAYYKGFEHLVEAAEQTDGARFLLVGDGPRYRAIKEAVRRKGLEQRVWLMGRVEDARLKVLFAECDVFCLPSIERTEAFGLVLLEAMSCGKPLITTRLEGSGVMYVNQHGETGLQVPPADPKALARAVNRLRRNDEERRRMGEAARERFETHFHIEAVAEKIECLYREVIQ
jgi:rhamnosyl/mannosyltransferase